MFDYVGLKKLPHFQLTKRGKKMVWEAGLPEVAK
jgi:hypothetical protein